VALERKWESVGPAEMKAEPEEPKQIWTKVKIFRMPSAGRVA
jgi:hypothetical protein